MFYTKLRCNDSFVNRVWAGIQHQQQKCNNLEENEMRRQIKYLKYFWTTTIIKKDNVTKKEAFSICRKPKSLIY